jgi:hypothetical protein
LMWPYHCSLLFYMTSGFPFTSLFPYKESTKKLNFIQCQRFYSKELLKILIKQLFTVLSCLTQTIKKMFTLSVCNVHHLAKSSAGALGPIVHIWWTEYRYGNQYPNIRMLSKLTVTNYTYWLSTFCNRHCSD